MRSFITLSLAAALAGTSMTAHAQTVPVERFHKVIVSPYIQAVFVEANEESVTINSIVVDNNKLHIESHHGTLRLYLDGAKDIPRNLKNNEYGDPSNDGHLYPDHAVTVTINYKKLDDLSLRGGEKYLCQSPLSTHKFRLRLYGETTMTFAEVHLGKMKTTIYGESSLDIRSGEVNKQTYTCYGEGKVNSSTIGGRAARLFAIGEAEFKVNVSDRIKVTAIGEARLRYLGNPTIVKGLHIGQVDMQRLD